MGVTDGHPVDADNNYDTSASADLTHCAVCKTFAQLFLIRSRVPDRADGLRRPPDEMTD